MCEQSLDHGFSVSSASEWLAQVSKKSTLKCLSSETPKTINFPFVPNGKFMIFRCPNIEEHYN